MTPIMLASASIALTHLLAGDVVELIDDQSVGEQQDPVGDRGDARLVRDGEDRLPERAGAGTKQCEDLATGL